MRDLPWEISQAPASQLQAEFQSPDELLANLAYQVFLRRKKGKEVTFGTSYRDAYYDPNLHTVHRAGFLNSGQGTIRSGALPESDLFELWQRVLLEMVNSDRLFNYTDLGFSDEYADSRQLGILSPHIILLAEKETQGKMVQQLALEFGYTSYVTKGISTLVSDEFLATALNQVTQKPLHIIAVVDHDPGGYLIGRTLVNHLNNYGLKIHRLDFLHGPHLFTPEEIARLAVPCAIHSKTQATKVRLWVEQTGGTNGLPHALHVNHLRPYNRLRAALTALLKQNQPPNLKTFL